MLKTDSARGINFLHENISLKTEENLCLECRCICVIHEQLEKETSKDLWRLSLGVTEECWG